MSNIYRTIELTNGVECQIINMTFGIFSKAIQKHSLQYEKEYDMMAFLTVECCLIDGKKQEMEYFLELDYIDYSNISEVLGVMMLPLKGL